MNLRKSILTGAAALLTLTTGQAQTFPSKPMTIVVPASPGGAIDLAARLIGQKMTEDWGQPVTIDNKAGATGIIGTDVVARAAPDGHTLVLVASSHTINPSMVRRLPFDTLKSFEPVGGSAEQFTHFIEKEMGKWAKVARDAGTQPE